MTVLDLIKRAMRLLNAINIGDDVTADEAADALLALNAMTDAWALQRLLMYTSSRTSYALTAGKQVYSLGPNATSPDWTGPRPPYLDGAGLLIPDSAGNSYERELDLITNDQEWAAVRQKSLTSAYPLALYYQPDYPAATLTLWPAPTQALSVVLYAPTAISQFANVAQTISLPPGYARALPYNLAVEMAPEFGKDPSDVVVAIAIASLADIKRKNLPASMGRLRVDSALQPRSGGNWDWTIGETR